MTTYDTNFPFLVNRQGDTDEFTTTSGNVRIIFVNDTFDAVYIRPTWQNDLTATSLAHEITTAVTLIQATIISQRPSEKYTPVIPSQLSEQMGKLIAEETSEAITLINEYITLRDAGKLPQIPSQTAQNSPDPDTPRVAARAYDHESLEKIWINQEWAEKSTAQTVSDQITEAIHYALKNSNQPQEIFSANPLLNKIQRHLDKAHKIIEENT